jgi:hypothetical protein
MNEAGYRGTDRLFAALMVLQWIGAIAAAMIPSPRSWNGGSSHVHIHVWAAIFLGGAIITMPLLLGLMASGETLTRHVRISVEHVSRDQDAYECDPRDDRTA